MRLFNEAIHIRRDTRLLGLVHLFRRHLQMGFGLIIDCALIDSVEYNTPISEKRVRLVLDAD